MSKIIGNTVGMGLPKPNLMQTDPTKGDYVKGKEEFLAQAGAGSGQNVTLTAAQINALAGMFKVCTFVKDDVSAEYAAFQTAFGITDSGDSGEDSGGEETGVSNETTWTDGVKYTYSAVDGEYIETDGTITPYADWSRTPYLYCSGVSTLRVVVQLTSTQFNTNCQYNAFYDGDKNFIKSFSFQGIDGNTEGAYFDVEIPDNAVYFVASHKRNIISTTNNSYGQAFAGFVPYA